MYEAAAEVTWHAVLEQTFYFIKIHFIYLSVSFKSLRGTSPIFYSLSVLGKDIQIVVVLF